MVVVHIVKTAVGTKKQFPENGNGHLTIIDDDGNSEDLVLTDG